MLVRGNANSRLRTCLLAFLTILLFVASGAVFLGIAAYKWIQPYVDVLRPADLFQFAAIALIAVGIAAIIAYVYLGYGAIFNEDLRRLTAFMIALAIIGLVTFGVGCWAGNISQNLTGVYGLYGLSTRSKGKLTCCNVVMTDSSISKIVEDRSYNPPLDYRGDKNEWKRYFESIKESEISSSCCILPQTTIMYLPETKIQECSLTSEIIYRQDCKSSFQSLGQPYMQAICGFGILNGVLQYVVLFVIRALAKRAQASESVLADQEEQQLQEIRSRSTQ